METSYDLVHNLLEQQRRERRLIAERITANPALIRIGIEKIDQWLERGHTARGLLLRSRALLVGGLESAAGLSRLAEVLRTEREDLLELAETLPLRDVLTDAEKQEIAAHVVQDLRLSQPRTHAFPTKPNLVIADSR